MNESKKSMNELEEKKMGRNEGDEVEVTAPNEEFVAAKMSIEGEGGGGRCSRLYIPKWENKYAPICWNSPIAILKNKFPSRNA
jgi:hypothetical protein